MHQLFTKSRWVNKKEGRILGFSTNEREQASADNRKHSNFMNANQTAPTPSFVVNKQKLSPPRSNEELRTEKEVCHTLFNKEKQKDFQKKDNVKDPRVTKLVGTTTSREESSTDGAASEQQNHKQPLRSQLNHPGLRAFHQWMSATSDIYRMYSIGKVNKDESAIPLLPRSERGRVPLHLQIQNRTITDIDVFWVDFKGREIPKGSMKQFNGSINITTWIGHPWAFRAKDSGILMLHYVPYRIIPVIDMQQNGSSYNEDDETGVHAFSIETAKNVEDMCSVQDNMFPYPANSITSINRALEFSIQQMEREQISPRILLKYFYNIALHPSESKYRQIRVANKLFWNNIWCNGGRGVLHALGFEENGSYIEMGRTTGNLPGNRVKDVSNVIVMLEEFMKDIEDSDKPAIRQPRGADGSGTGRANWRM
jgi:hypothetical protein